jgi:hypothetical protein
VLRLRRRHQLTDISVIEDGTSQLPTACRSYKGFVHQRFASVLELVVAD